MNLLYNMSTPWWTFRYKVFTLAMIFLPQGVIILQHEIFSLQHWGKYIMALNCHLLKNITASNICSSSGGENIIPSNIYPFHEVRILCSQIFTPFHGVRIEKYWICTPLPDYHEIALNAHLKAGNLVVPKLFMPYFCGTQTKCLPLYTKFVTTSGDK